MLDYTQTFAEFSKSVKPIDLALYAGIGMVLWVLFKDKLSPVQKIVMDLFSKTKNAIETSPVVAKVTNKNNDNFFELVVSWKKTRDLAVKSGCSEAVKVADQMFPFLSPTVCGEEKV